MAADRTFIIWMVAVKCREVAFGIALWAAAELKLDVPNEVVRDIDAFLTKKKNGGTFGLI